MRHRVLLIVLLVALAIGLESCRVGSKGCCCAGGSGWGVGHKVKGSGTVIQVDRSIGGIDAVHLATIGTLHIEFGDREKLVIEGEDNIIERIEVEVDEGTLVIDKERGYNLRPSEPLNYYVTVKRLESISLSSSGDAVIPDVKSPSFSINVSSSGDVKTGRIETERLKVRLSSSGDISIRSLECEDLHASLSSSGSLAIGGGIVSDQDVRLSSSGSYRAEDLESESADVRLSSSGNAYVTVTEDLNARMSSSGSVYYAGNPRVTQRRSSSGRLKRIDL